MYNQGVVRARSLPRKGDSDSAPLVLRPMSLAFTTKSGNLELSQILHMQTAISQFHSL